MIENLSLSSLPSKLLCLSDKMPQTLVVVVLPDPLRGVGAWKNSTETQQSGHAPRFRPEIKNGSSAKDGAPERLGCGTVKEVC